MGALQQYEVLVSTDLLQDARGQPPTMRIKKSVVQHQKRLFHLCDDYRSGRKHSFLTDSVLVSNCSTAGLLRAVAWRYRYCSGATFTVAVAPLLLIEKNGGGSTATFSLVFLHYALLLLSSLDNL